MKAPRGLRGPFSPNQPSKSLKTFAEEEFVDVVRDVGSFLFSLTPEFESLWCGLSTDVQSLRSVASRGDR